MVTPPGFWSLPESRIAKGARDSQKVAYSVTPIYKPGQAVPDHVHISAEGNQGMDVDCYVKNDPVSRDPVCHLDATVGGIIVSEYVTFLGEERRNRPASHESWTVIETDLGVEFPQDYKDFVDGYGDCIVAGHLYVPHPEGADRLRSWILTERADLDDLFEFSERMPDFIREDYGRLIPWGYHNWNGDNCYFLPPKGERDWIIVVLFRQCPDVLIFEDAFSRFIEKICTDGRMPRGWPRRQPVWESAPDSPLI